MQLPLGNLTALLLALNLSQGTYKPEPTPSALDVQGKTRIKASSFSPPLLSPDLAQLEAAASRYGEPDAYDSSENAADSDTGDVYASSSCSVQPYNPGQVSDQTFPPFDQSKASVYRYRKQRSVNLGSWYVLLH